MARTSTKNSVYFNGCKTLADLEQRIMVLLAEHGDDDSKIAEITQEYDTLFIAYKKKHNKDKEEWQKVKENPEEMRTVALKLLTYKDAENDLDFKRDCKIELCGTWLWIQPADGKDAEITKKYSKLLNKKNGVGCNWSTKKNMWYWHSETGKKKWIPRKSAFSMDQIRDAYGSRILDTEEAV